MRARFFLSEGRSFVILAAAFTLAASPATISRAQVGNENPTGPAGIFNGNVTTGCSYDPLTGNDDRSEGSHLDVEPLALVGACSFAHGTLDITSDGETSQGPAWLAGFGHRMPIALAPPPLSAPLLVRRSAVVRLPPPPPSTSK